MTREPIRPNGINMTF